MHGDTPHGYLNCPRCHLSIPVRAEPPTGRNCPRCEARSKAVVAMFSSTLPMRELLAGPDAEIAPEP